MERLQKFLANAGIASRRKCEELIEQGKVSVNGSTVTELGVKIDPEKDEVTFNGKRVELKNNKVYILLNKPIGYVTTAKDQFNRDTVMDLVKIKERVTTCLNMVGLKDIVAAFTSNAKKGIVTATNAALITVIITLFKVITLIDLYLLC